MKMERPAERWFWFDPPFNRGRSALLHKQADDVWRLDFQVGDEADRDEEMKPENVAHDACAPCWARTSSSISSGSASIASSRAAHTASGTVGFFLAAMPRIRCRRSARAAATAAYRMPTTSPGNSIWSCAGWRRTPARQLPRRARSGGRREPAAHHALHGFHRAQERDQPHCSATAPWRWPRPSRSRAGWSIRGGSRRRLATGIRAQRSRRVHSRRSPGGLPGRRGPRCPARQRRLAVRPDRRRLHRCLVQSRRGGPARAGAGVRRTGRTAAAH